MSFPKALSCSRSRQLSRSRKGAELTKFTRIRSAIKTVVVAVLLAVGTVLFAQQPASAAAPGYLVTSGGSLNTYLARNSGGLGGTGCSVTVSTWYNNPNAFPGVGWKAACQTGHYIQVYGYLYSWNGSSWYPYLDSGWVNYGYASSTVPTGWMTSQCPAGHRYWLARPWLSIDGVSRGYVDTPVAGWTACTTG